jgi:hypothetical protein
MTCRILSYIKRVSDEGSDCICIITILTFIWDKKEMAITVKMPIDNVCRKNHPP